MQTPAHLESNLAVDVISLIMIAHVAERAHHNPVPQRRLVQF